MLHFSQLKNFHTIYNDLFYNSLSGFVLKVNGVRDFFFSEMLGNSLGHYQLPQQSKLDLSILWGTKEAHQYTYTTMATDMPSILQHGWDISSKLRVSSEITCFYLWKIKSVALLTRIKSRNLYQRLASVQKLHKLTHVSAFI